MDAGLAYDPQMASAGGPYADVLTELRERMRLSLAADSKNREEALDDLEFLSGRGQWDEQTRRIREAEGRPCMVVNKLPTFLHLVQNNLRQNVPSIHVAPVDSDADIKTAEVLQGLIRHIEYNSNADVAYDTASSSAAQVGFGYFRLVTEFCAPDSFDQDIRFKRIRNPFTVYFDPQSQEADGSDAMWCILSTKLSRDEFARMYPKAQATSAGFNLGTGDGNNTDWFGNDFIRLAEYYRIVQVDDTLIELSDGSKGWKSQLVDMGAAVIVRSRPSTRRVLEWRMCSAFEVLEVTEIKCPWIPVFPVYGDELDIDGRIVRSGVVRQAKDPARIYNYWLTSATEEVALRTKTPFIGAEGQFEGHEDEWGQANIRSFPYLEYKPVDLEGNLAPPPQRQPMADIPSGFLQMALIANDNIKATTGLFDSSLGSIGTATSGIQERAQQRQGDLSNFHFADNLMRAVRHAGRCIVAMVPHYYDSTRVVRILGVDGEMSHVTINEPKMQNGEMGAIETVLHDMTVGTYDVTCSSGPAYATLRQEAAEAQTGLAKAWPKLMEVAGDIVVKNFDWPGAQEISERIQRTIPPQIVGDDAGDEESDEPVVRTPKGDIPVDQAAQMLEEMNSQIQQMGAALKEAESGITKAKIDAESRVQVAEINAVSRSDVEELKGLVALLLQRMQPPPALVAEVAQDATKDG